MIEDRARGLHMGQSAIATQHRPFRDLQSDHLPRLVLEEDESKMQEIKKMRP